MRMRRSPQNLRLRGPLLAVLTLGLVTVLAAPAGAVPLVLLTGPVTGTVTVPAQDGTCPENPGFPGVQEFHQQFSGLLAGRGPDSRVDVSACQVFTGAMGGINIEGTFTLRRPGAAVTSTMQGVIAFFAVDSFRMVLQVDGRGRPGSGRLYFSGCLRSFVLSDAQVTTTERFPVCTPT